MQPTDPQYSMEYLDSIASKPQVKTLNPFVLWGIIGAILVLAVVVVMSVLSNGGNPDALTTVGGRLAALKEISSKSQDKLQSSNLRTLNSNLTLVLTNANRDMEAPLAAKKVKLDDKKNSSVKVVNAETDKVNSSLEDARLNAVFDRTYAREISFYLKTLRSDMSELYDSSRSKQLKTALVEIDANIKTLQSGFEKFNAG